MQYLIFPQAAPQVTSAAETSIRIMSSTEAISAESSAERPVQEKKFWRSWN